MSNVCNDPGYYENGPTLINITSTVVVIVCFSEKTDEAANSERVKGKDLLQYKSIAMDPKLIVLIYLRRQAKSLQDLSPSYNHCCHVVHMITWKIALTSRRGSFFLVKDGDRIDTLRSERVHQNDHETNREDGGAKNGYARSMNGLDKGFSSPPYDYFATANGTRVIVPLVLETK
ncbi:hypothetical protein JB92DRAFT_2835143 [Gautieria morchelliformis]|nr:hypothetical protein JB92DRAFT_2835143 [Gautieria morchelliformis]